VALADLPVVEIVRGGDFDDAGAEIALDIGIGDDGDFAVSEWQ